ncbi:DNA cytosine methyltransferase [Mycoplana dimorpha]|uniref:DNA (cytosine-5-)-methyltransferase n=1 Tax=Mycoplana dimorpha TaxID=28320 RepID=A0A2T5AHG1_MYCDI|nr:DNA (cytosine-5-)-methyltransferase [Mycoplana dimorpha]PTM86165.1 DNA-cytosine methyltransferase [Mycoplana dimorpha]
MHISKDELNDEIIAESSLHDGVAITDDPADMQKPTSFSKMRNRARTIRKQWTRQFVELVDMVGELPQKDRGERLAILVHDWGFTKREASLLLKTAKATIPDRELLLELAVAPEVVASLATARNDVKKEALLQIENGRTLQSSDLARIRSNLDAAKPEFVRSTHQRFLVGQATRRRKCDLATYMNDLLAFVDALVEHHELDQCNEQNLAERQQPLIHSAQQLQQRFTQYFDVNRLPAVEQWFFDAGDSRELRLAKAYLALKRLAIGDFYDAEYANGETDRYIEAGIIRKIAWLCSAELSRLNKSVAARDSRPEPSLTEVLAARAVRKPFMLLEICAGAGGQATGLHAAGFASLGVFEQNVHAVNTLEANFAFGPLHQVDIREFDFSVYRDQIDLLAGGVPCQPHSALGSRRGGEDERDLFMVAIDIIREVRPRAVMLENVTGFDHAGNAEYRAKVFAELKKAGYEAALFPIAAKDFGLAQKRPRLVLIAFRDGHMSRFRMPTVFPEWKLTLGEALRDLMSANGWKGVDAWVERANKFAPTLVGGSDKTSIAGFASKFQEQEWLELGVDPTGLADAAPAADAPINLVPRLTLGMAARLQGFIEHWQFTGSKRQQRQQIANAFPPVLARAVGLAIYSALAQVEIDFEAELQEPLGHYPLGDAWMNFAVTKFAEDLDLPLGRQRNPRDLAFAAKFKENRERREKLAEDASVAKAADEAA